MRQLGARLDVPLRSQIEFVFIISSGAPVYWVRFALREKRVLSQSRLNAKRRRGWGTYDHPLFSASGSSLMSDRF